MAVFLKDERGVVAEHEVEVDEVADDAFKEDVAVKALYALVVYPALKVDA